jgi:ribosomal-protein-serine acetyltransferase
MARVPGAASRHLCARIGACEGLDAGVVVRPVFDCQVNDRIRMALFEPPHARELFDLIEANRPQLRQWLNWLDHRRNPADVAAYIGLCLRQFAAHQGFHAGIWFDGRLCGMVAHHGIDWPNQTTSLEYWLDVSHQGKGIMTASCRAVIDHSFNTLLLNRVIIRCATGNQRSRAVAERLGFTFEGISRQAEWLYGRCVDLAVYGLLKTDKVPG